MITIEKKKKKKTIIISSIVGLVLVLTLLFIFAVPKKQSLCDISNTLHTLENGSYCGKCQNGIVMAEVEVEVKNHTITTITILKHRNGKGQTAESITNDVIKAQTLDVDTVSGATYSSYTILKAIEKAIVSTK